MKTKRKLQTMLLALSISLFFIPNSLWSQSSPNKSQGRHEIKINALHILLESIEVSYDYVLGEQSTVGLSLGVSTQENLGYEYMLVPNYKLFFNEKKAAGFFIEANSALYSEKNRGEENTFGFGLGIAIGGKFINKKGFIGELILGGGRNFSNTDLIGEAYPRFGISIGKRF